MIATQSIRQGREASMRDTSSIVVPRTDVCYREDPENNLESMNAIHLETNTMAASVVENG